jgi:RHS repeat-associated protein
MPYGESWVEEGQWNDFLRIKFNGKEQDPETNMYYYGARYLDPMFSRWASPDPAFEKYLPEAPIDKETLLRNRELPGEGGVFNSINVTLYCYAANNPLKYVDPTGEYDAPVHGSITRTALEAVGFPTGNYANDIISTAQWMDFDKTYGTSANYGLHINSFSARITGQDSRQDAADKEFQEAVKLWNSDDKKGAIKALGRGLHSIEDKEAHKQLLTGPAGWIAKKLGHPELAHQKTTDQWGNDPAADQRALENSENYIKKFMDAVGIKPENKKE